MSFSKKWNFRFFLSNFWVLLEAFSMPNCFGSLVISWQTELTGAFISQKSLKKDKTEEQEASKTYEFSDFQKCCYWDLRREGFVKFWVQTWKDDWILTQKCLEFMSLNVFFSLEPLFVKAIHINLEHENHSPGGYVRRSLKTLYFLLSFGQLCDIFEAFVDVPMHQIHFYVFEKNEISSKNERKTSRNQYVWAFIFEWSMFTVMHSGKTSEIEKCSPGVHVRRESKKSRFFLNSCSFSEDFDLFRWKDS